MNQKEQSKKRFVNLSHRKYRQAIACAHTIKNQLTCLMKT
jgi:hypothetical protein